MAKSKRKNPFASGKTLKWADIPKGLKSGQVFKKGGKNYMVISYRHPMTNKLVRYARPYKGYKGGASKKPGYIAPSRRRLMRRRR